MGIYVDLKWGKSNLKICVGKWSVGKKALNILNIRLIHRFFVSINRLKIFIGPWYPHLCYKIFEIEYSGLEVFGFEV